MALLPGRALPAWGPAQGKGTKAGRSESKAEILPSLASYNRLSAQPGQGQAHSRWQAPCGSPSAYLGIQGCVQVLHVFFGRKQEDTPEAGMEQAALFAFQNRLHRTAKTESCLLDTGAGSAAFMP